MTRNKNRISTNQKVRLLLVQGKTTKEICMKLKVAPQVVYNVKYSMNKKKGIASLPGRPKGTGIKKPAVVAETPTPVHAPEATHPVATNNIPFFTRVIRWFKGE